MRLVNADQPSLFGNAHHSPVRGEQSHTRAFGLSKPREVSIGTHNLKHAKAWLLVQSQTKRVVDTMDAMGVITLPVADSASPPGNKTQAETRSRFTERCERLGHAGCRAVLRGFRATRRA